jgi:BCD family chlorophyll transporter-like MFS transporter
MVVSSMLFGWLLADFSQLRLIQVIQGAAVATMLLNMVALWKQEARDPVRTAASRERSDFMTAWRALRANSLSMRMLVAIALGTSAFSMQDILLEPFGGEVLHLPVGATTKLTGLLALGTLIGLGLAAHRLSHDGDPARLAALGALTGLMAFPAILLSAPAQSAELFAVGTALVGFGGGLFSVGMLTAVMNADNGRQSGLALGAWGAVQATAAGLAIAIGGAVRDTTVRLGADGTLGPAFVTPAAGYSVVYHLEILLLIATLVALGPLVRSTRFARASDQRFGLAQFPG